VVFGGKWITWLRRSTDNVDSDLKFHLISVIAIIVSLSDVSSACYAFPADRRDPCVGRHCQYGARCLPSRDGRKSRCVCPTRCDQFGDAVGSSTVCGSDGHDYASVCELHRAACRQLKNIDKKYDGKCGEDCVGLLWSKAIALAI